MKIHDVEQRSPEWHRLRTTDFTASEFDAYCLEPRTVVWNKDQISDHLTSLRIDHKKTATKDALVALAPDPSVMMGIGQGAMTAILRKIQQGKINAMRRKAPEERSDYERLTLEWADEMDEANERKMAYNIDVRRGNALEPEARFFYEERTGYKVDQPGYCQHDAGGFGCSPDGMVFKGKASDALIDINPDGSIKISYVSHGLEIKCPMPETHMAYLLAGTLPHEYKHQVHGSMAVTGLDRWDFLSYCPGEAPLLLTVKRDEFTDRLERGLIELVAEKKKIEARLAQIWMDAYA